MTDELELRNWLRLSRMELSCRAAGALIERYGGPGAVFDASETELGGVDQLTDKGRSKILGPIPAAIERDLQLIEQMGLQVIPIISPEYPASLKEIYDPPVVLYVRGQLIESDKLSVAIVGSRRASIYGRTIAERIARELAVRGLAVISGGARGIDTSAHKGALAAGGRTVAFLGRESA